MKHNKKELKKAKVEAENKKTEADMKQLQSKVANDLRDILVKAKNQFEKK